MVPAVLLITSLHAQTPPPPNPRSPQFTSGPTQGTTQPPAPPSQFTTGSAPPATTAPSFTSGAAPSTAGPGSYTTGTRPSNTAAPSFTSGPVPLTTGAFAQPVQRVPIVSDGIVVGNVFIPLQRPAPTGPTREVYLPALDERLHALDVRAALLRTRAFEHRGDNRAELQRLVGEALTLLVQARAAQGNVRNVLEENFPDAREQMDALLLEITRRLDLVEAGLA